MANKGSLTLQEVADDLGFSYETVRQLCHGSAGEPLPFIRSSTKPRARWVIPASAYEEWKARRVEACTAPYRRQTLNLEALRDRGGAR